MKRRWRLTALLISACLSVILFNLGSAQGTKIRPAWGIAVAPEGTIYFSDVERHRIWMITLKGRLKTIATQQTSHSLFFAPDGYLYGENAHYDPAGKQRLSAFWRAQSDNLFEEIVPPTASVPPGLGLCRDTAGAIYAIEQNETVARLTKRANGNVSVLAGGTRGYADGIGTEARFNFLEAMTIGADGAVYVRDNDTIRRVTPEGRVSTVGGKPLGGIPHAQQNGLLGLAADKRGNVYVADMEAHSVRRINPENQVETVWQSSWFWTPTGVAVNENGIYVLENLSPSPILLVATLGIGPYIRVHRLGPDRVPVKLATVWGPTTRTALGLLILFFALFSLWRLRRAEMERDI